MICQNVLWLGGIMQQIIIWTNHEIDPYVITGELNLFNLKYSFTYRKQFILHINLIWNPYAHWIGSRPEQ